MRQQQWKWLIVVWQFLLVAVFISLVLSQILFPRFVCRVQKSEPFVDFVEVNEDDPTVKSLSCKNQVLGIPDRIPEEYSLPQWNVMEYRDPDFINP